MRIDAHQHFWNHDAVEHVWMTEEMGVLKRDLLPGDLLPLLEQSGFSGTVAVQARQNLRETEFLLELAETHDFIRGVVGWVDLKSPDVEKELETYSRHPKLRGVRHVVHDEPDDRFMLLPKFLRGLGHLTRFGLTYDLLLFPRHILVAAEVVKKFPDVRFVLDHIAKPSIGDRRVSPWDRDLRELASFPNVHCKLSGMVTEATWREWRYEDFVPYLDIVVDCFGTERLMIGSDWPVCTLSGDYQEVMQIVLDYVGQLSPYERDGILGRNAVEFYGIS